MSMPNWVPQSPRWLILTTSWPTHSSRRQILSPIIVDLPIYLSMILSWLRAYKRRNKLPSFLIFNISISKSIYLRCPTCISLAMLGEEKSTSALRLTPNLGGLTPRFNSSPTWSATKSLLRNILINPGPWTSTCKMFRYVYLVHDNSQQIYLYMYCQCVVPITFLKNNYLLWLFLLRILSIHLKF